METLSIIKYINEKRKKKKKKAPNPALLQLGLEAVAFNLLEMMADI